MQRKIIVAVLSLLLASPPLSLAQGSLDLKLPSGEELYRELQEEQRGGPCERCGVVYRVRSESRQGPGRRDPANAARRDIGSGEGYLVTTPLIGTGSTVKDSRQATAPVQIYIITVRYEDGSFAAFEQRDEPALRAGDRVRVIEGRVELRSD